MLVALITGQASKGLILVEYLNVGTIAGLPIAIAAYSIEGRASGEINILFITRTVMLAYPLLITRNKSTLAQTWVQQLALATVLYTLLPLINALTTDKHLGITLSQGDWIMAISRATIQTTFPETYLIYPRNGFQPFNPGLFT